MRRAIFTCVLAIALILAGCTATPAPTATPEVEEALASNVSVTGKVTPAVWTTVGTQTGGMVVAVLVETGDAVAVGDVLVRFDDADARLAIQQAEAAVKAAEAQVAQVRLKPSPEDIAVAETQITAATSVISQALAQRSQLWDGSWEAQIAAAEASIAAAQAEQLVARQQHDDTMKCETVNGQKMCPLLGTYEERARFALNAADTQVAAAQAHLKSLQSGRNAQIRIADAAVAVATAQREVAAAQLAQLDADVAPEVIAVAEAAVTQAQAQLDAAKVALTRTEVRAPIAGVVGQVDVRLGEFVAPGMSLITLGDLTTLRVETTDLDEIDVAQIVEGQAAVLTCDAFPDRLFAGRVTRIAPMADAGGGGVNFTVIIELDQPEAGLRWGMTMFVDIEKQP